MMPMVGVRFEGTAPDSPLKSEVRRFPYVMPTEPSLGHSGSNASLEALALRLLSGLTSCLPNTLPQLRWAALSSVPILELMAANAKITCTHLY
jgi:hypothetical protein